MDDEEAADPTTLVRSGLATVAEFPLLLVPRELTSMVLAGVTLVVVPSLTSAEVLRPKLVDTYPGHDVLPITVTTVGCDAPSLIAL